MNLAPIILFVYNRPWHTKQTLEALILNEYADQSTLFIYCDGPKEDASDETLKTIKEVREVIREKKWCKEVIIVERDFNIGLAANIIGGVSEIVNKFEKIIVLEDDIKVDSLFLSYMNEALNFYKNNKNVFHINGFNNESNLQFLLKNYYFLNFMSCWGWGTWKDRWNQLIIDHEYFYKKLIADSSLLSKFNYNNTLDFHLQLKSNIDGKIKTWAILWFSTVFFNKGLCLTPKYTLVENIGLDGSGINCGVSSSHKKIYVNKNQVLTKQFNHIDQKELFLSKLHLKLFYKYGMKFNIFAFFKLKIKIFLKSLI